MKKLIIAFVIFVSFLIFGNILGRFGSTYTYVKEAEAKFFVKEVEIINHATYLEKLVHKYAVKYNVSQQLMVDLIDCENIEWKIDKQSTLRYSKDHPNWKVKKGDRELSYGLSMIHLPSHPKITREQAINPEFALNFMAQNLSVGNAEMWSCYKG